MQKLLFIFLIILIAWFQLQLRIGKGGYADDKLIKQEIVKQTNLNKELLARNNAMQIKTSGLKGSHDLIEARSRMELNMIRSGEMLVLLPGNTNLASGK